MKASTSIAAFLVGSLVLLALFCPALALSSLITAPGMSTESVNGSSWYSTNWSAYAVTGSNVTFVQGSWIVPTVTGSRFATAYSSFWVGIDGFSSSTVEQTGTDSDVQRGRSVYYAWYEFYPSEAMQQISGFTIKPGDVISASVTYSSGVFTLLIADENTGASYSKTGTVSGATETSAEWIAEAPSSYFGVLPLANFGTVNFANCYTTVVGTTGSIGSFGSAAVQEITMVSRRGAVKALPSALSGGTSFSVVWKSAGP